MRIVLEIPDELVDEIDEEISLNSHNECGLGPLPSVGAWAKFQEIWFAALQNEKKHPCAEEKSVETLCVAKMKTKDELQSAVNEIRAVCKKHGIALVGTCSSEGIYGEITLGGATQSELGWANVKDVVDNAVVCDREKWFYVAGIGDVES